MNKIISEFNRLNGVLGQDSCVQDCLQAVQSGHGDEKTLRAAIADCTSTAWHEAEGILSRITRDQKGNGSVTSLSAADQDALETALHKHARYQAAAHMLDTVWPPEGVTAEEAKCVVREHLSRGHGGVKSGCTAKRASKRIELEGEGESKLPQWEIDNEQMAKS